MFRQTLYASFMLFSYATSFASRPHPWVIDPESIKDDIVQTRNGLGITFNDLGTFEDEFIKDCRLVDMEQCHEGKILLLGEGYGRLTMRVLRQTENCMVFCNELAQENMVCLTTKLKDIKEIGLKKLASGATDISELGLTSRIHTIVGDCLQLPFNKEFNDILNSHNPYNSFDRIMCSNTIHFFDGEQVLKFFINAFNFLKPGGSLYVMCHSATERYSQEEILQSNNPILPYITALAVITEFASAQENLMFPGLIDDKWLGKSNILRTFVMLKPNNKHINNAMLPDKLSYIARQLGFEIISSKNYALMMDKTKHKCMRETKEIGPYGALILKKSHNCNGPPLMMRDLDQKLVDNCLHAAKKMKEFIDTKLNFPEKYPYVELKKN